MIKGTGIVIIKDGQIVHGFWPFTHTASTRIHHGSTELYSCTLCEQKRARERQKIVSFPGDVTTLGLFQAHVCRLHMTWEIVSSRVYT